ncbi:CBS domain-containing protein [Desulfobulbus elongatus]|uniref:CBS domain-containing protein n=1 Tax=Desulfobulbus elongatus TaxID=53332 RepID=UPI000A410D7E|nr:CBS domain-containing protein [Desulfobulbus elongatus]
MERLKIKEWVRPIEAFPRISNRASLMEAVAALKKSDAEYRAGLSSQRILLAYDVTGRVVGKLSPADIVEALASTHGRADAKAGQWLARPFRALGERLTLHLPLWSDPLPEHWRKIHRLNVHSFVKGTAPGRTIQGNETMGAAFRLFAGGRHDSLFVVRRGEIIGLLLFADVYRKITDFLQSCPLAELGTRTTVRRTAGGGCSVTAR